MVVIKFAIICALVLVAVKFIASAFGKGDIPLLNQAVTLILGLFVAFEVVQLGQAMLAKIN